MQTVLKLARLYGSSSEGCIKNGTRTPVAFKNYGVAVWNEGTMKMCGGKLAGNAADFDGAVYAANGSKYQNIGGWIEDNKSVKKH